MTAGALLISLASWLFAGVLLIIAVLVAGVPLAIMRRRKAGAEGEPDESEP